MGLNKTVRNTAHLVVPLVFGSIGTAFRVHRRVLIEHGAARGGRRAAAAEQDAGDALRHCALNEARPPAEWRSPGVHTDRVLRQSHFEGRALRA